MNINSIISTLAGDVVTFVDDLRANGSDADGAWQVARWFASRLQFLGIQDAPRKRRAPSRTPGAWAGAVFKTSEEAVTKTVMQAKWD